MSELAIVEENAVAGRAEEQLVTMTVDKQLFGLPILSVQDIVETHSITRVPLTQSAVSGVMNLRGRIVTVIDLRRILGKTDDAQNKMGVTVEYQGDLYTILVDSIGEVCMLERSAFEPAPSTLDPTLKQLCTGIYRLDGELLTVLDVDRVLDTEIISQTPPVNFVAKKQPPKIRRARTEESETKDGAKASEAEANPSEGDADTATKDRPAKKEKSTAAARASGKPREQASDGEDEKSLFEQLGGSAAIEAAVEQFYGKVMGDASLAEFFDGIDMDRQKSMITEFLTMATGGPGRYSGRDLRTAHARLVEEKGLSGRHFDAVADHLKATLRELNVPFHLVSEAVATVASTRDDVLVGPEHGSGPEQAQAPEPEQATEPEQPAPAVPAPAAATDETNQDAADQNESADATVEEGSLFDQIGGANALTEIVATFYEKAQANPKLENFYADADMASQQKAFVAFLTVGLGGPSNGHAKAHPTHAWLVPKSGMNDDHFNQCLMHLEATLQAQSVPEGLIFGVLAAVERNRESIVD